MIKSVIVLFFVVVAAAVLLTGCASSGSKMAFSDVPKSGDMSHGAELFANGANGAPACTTCHRTDSVNGNGPGLGGIADRAGTRVANLSAREYVFQSITEPGKFVVSGFTNQMYADYSQKYKPQDVADLIAYLLSGQLK